MSFSDMDGATEQGTAVSQNASVTVDVHFDFVCPWCLIGKRNLDAAVSRIASLRPDVSVKVRWHSHQLLPDTPVGGVPYQAFYVARLGSPGAVAARRAQVQEAAHAAGIELAFDRIEVMPNTRAAHQLVAWATAANTGAACKPALLIDRLFTAYFMDGEDIGNPDVLERIGLACGLDAAGLADHLTMSRREGNIALPRSTQADDVRGVPHFVVNSALSLSGAYSPGPIVDAMLRSIGDQENR
ncbi:DsbA family oxidoreductase [Paraburkholderia elongata]|uniref:DsbA family oxidoreductase n=1 Tax=Paraburkholderia elongata TaxID=2675747 RepID=A0A972NSH0_9BURK|nr:DsbA family oxidoreductase [Paraburkholderia elongata]NPT57774.1 DsbA family oxidoreductase [Paraburkholderia elongata]